MSCIEITDVLRCINPATGELLGNVRITTPEEVHDAVARARRVFPEWAQSSFAERRRIILNVRQRILGQIEEIATLITMETGKPKVEALSCDIIPALEAITFFARKAERILKPQRIGLGKYHLLGRTSFLRFHPLGVIGIIAPWNFPLGIPLSQIVMALMAGNVVVLKPSEHTPLVGFLIGELFRTAGLPEGVLTLLQGDGSTGAALVEAGVDKIIFTGSVATGKKVAAAAARTLTPVILELGGKDPMIVLKDADLEAAASAAVWGAFCNSGQVCASVERCYVDETIADQFIAKVVEKTRRLRQGSPDDPDVDVGAMISEGQLRLVQQHVDEAVRRGAIVLCGGERNRAREGFFYQPTVLTDVDLEATLLREETFGPVLPIIPFRTEEEALRWANDSPYGLTASIWTKDIERAKKLAARIEAGTVMINECTYTYALAQTPWGGIKSSGIGITHSPLGLRELVRLEHVHINRFPRLKDFWWYGYSEEVYRLFIALARYFTSPSLIEKIRALPWLLRGLRLKKY
ncbi:MAG TPA: aldehyde dehydrogenase family protein [Blastocatellia bacterium]|nr:aldehyde dehydrogenase family protein [Blastocatellia bacterium]